jgi:hypothetical protein
MFYPNLTVGDKMEARETLCRVRRIHKFGGCGSISPALRNPAPRTRVPETRETEPETARAKAEGQSFRFPRPCRGLGWLLFGLSGQLVVGQSPVAGRGGRNSSAPSSVFRSFENLVDFVVIHRTLGV